MKLQIYAAFFTYLLLSGTRTCGDLHSAAERGCALATTRWPVCPNRTGYSRKRREAAICGLCS